MVSETITNITIDMHADTLQRVLDENVDLDGVTPGGHIDIPRMKQGGLNAQFFSIWVEPRAYPKEKAVTRSWNLIAALKKQLARFPEALELALSAKEIKRIINSGKIAAAMGIEGGHSLNGKIELLREFFDAGVRYMTLSWSNTNEICGSSGDNGREHGLFPFGYKVVRLMNELGMLVDISHVSDRAFYDVLKFSSKPVICSHSNLRKLCRHPRNLTDEMMRDLGQHGGVCCFNFYPTFLDDSYFHSYSSLAARLAAVAPQGEQAVERERAEWWRQLPKVSFTKVVDHIEAAVEIAGIDHVGIGSDFDGIPSVPVGLEDVSKLPALRDELAKRGFDAQSIAKVMGGNILRVFESAAN